MLPPHYDATRRSLHAVAEHVLAAARHQAVGRIGLEVTSGGFGTPTFDGRRLRVDGVDLVVQEGETERRQPLTTLAAAGRFVGIEPGMSPSVYRPVTPLDLDRPLDVDPAAAAALAGWLALADEALRTFTTAVAAEDATGAGAGLPATPTLWPEHFDLGLSAEEVNYGASPGDADLPEPYAYVGPWARPLPGDGGFWNQAFGATLGHDEVEGPAQVVAFFEAGRAAAHPG